MGGFGIVGLMLEIVTVTGLSISDIYELPICESLYYVNYLIVKHKEAEKQIKAFQMSQRQRG